MKFLFHVMDNAAAFFSSIPVAKELEKRGHSTLFFPFKLHQFYNQYTDKIPALDIETLAQASEINLFKHDLPTVHVNRSFPTPSTLLGAYEFAIVTKYFTIPLIKAYLPLTEQVFLEYKPDVVIVDFAGIPGAFIAEKHKIPWASFYRFACILESKDPSVPPSTLGLPVAKNQIMKTVYMAAKAGMSLYFKQFDKTLNQIREDLGIPYKKNVLRESPVSPYLVIAFTVPEFEISRNDWLPQLHFVGPYLWNTAPDLILPDWLEQLPDSKPVVFVTLGTLCTRLYLSLYEVAMETIQDMNVTGVISAGAYRDTWTFNKLSSPPKNCFTAPFLPYSVILPKSSVVIHHGGTGAAISAISYGVPQVIIPLTYDNFDNAQRSVEAGVAVRLKVRGITPKKLKNRINLLLSEPNIRKRCIEMRKVFSRYDSPVMSADLLIKLAQKKEIITRER
jgi:MGT family glycosyltransferase